MKEMKLETIKKNVKEMVRGRVSRAGGWPGDAQFLALMPAVEMRVKPGKLVDEWADEALKIVDRWDVRMVAKLIELFPESIPKKFRGLPMAAYMADNENCDWMVQFGT